MILLLTTNTTYGNPAADVTWGDGSSYVPIIDDATGENPPPWDILAVLYYTDSVHHFFLIRTFDTAILDPDTTFGIVISLAADDGIYEFAFSTLNDETTLGVFIWMGPWSAIDTLADHVRFNVVGPGVEFALDVGTIPFNPATDYFKAVLAYGPAGGSAFTAPTGAWVPVNDPSNPPAPPLIEDTPIGTIGVIPEFPPIGLTFICGTLLLGVVLFIQKKKF